MINNEPPSYIVIWNFSDLKQKINNKLAYVAVNLNNYYSVSVEY